MPDHTSGSMIHVSLKFDLFLSAAAARQNPYAFDLLYGALPFACLLLFRNLYLYLYLLPQFGALKRGISNAAAEGLEFPDAAFILNTDDMGVCTKEMCPGPIFSLHKHQDHLDLMLPVSYYNLTSICDPRQLADWSHLWCMVVGLLPPTPHT
jgi:hypothetical protein